MQTTLSPESKGPPDGDAEAILRKCVHCGFCTATSATHCETTCSSGVESGRFVEACDRVWPRTEYPHKVLVLAGPDAGRARGRLLRRAAHAPERP